ncbi:MAG TPA: TatD family hydrolase [Dyella sp.]|nr:TatD family hydrolase [Dyella sp.]
MHLDDERFDEDRDAVIERAARVGVRDMIVPSTDHASWSRIGSIARAHKNLFPAFGLHPMFLTHHRLEHLQALEGWLDQQPAVAVGEIGLDLSDPALDRKAQDRYFERQLAIARERDLAVIIHARRAVEEVLLALRRHPGSTGVVHSFSGSEQQAQRLMDMGFCLGLGGPVTYPRAQRLHRIVSAMPIDFLMLESDAPDQPGVDHRGERNEPAFLSTTVREIAALRQESEASIAQATTANVERVFRLTRFRERSTPT